MILPLQLYVGRYVTLFGSQHDPTHGPDKISSLTPNLAFNVWRIGQIYAKQGTTVSDETMTRPEWQKKKKKMAGREGPKKGKKR